MLRVLRVFVLSCCLASAASAGPLTVGLRAGSSIPDLRDNGGNDLSKGWSSRVAPYFGAFAELQVTPAFSVQAEVDYAAQGGKKDGLQPIITDLSALGAPADLTLYARFKNTAKLDYLEIPVLAKYHFGPANRLFVGAGPYVGFLLSAKTVTSGQSSIYLDPQGAQPLVFPQGSPYEGQPIPPQDFGATTDGKADLHAFNWGVQAGVGCALPAGPGVASLELRGGLGLANLQKDTATNGKNVTGNLVIALGYGMRFGGR
jgi:hypothetical protein